ncbi:MAG: transposase [Ruminococcaceae bacterium]|nr:transposase [Oscillospiraceae bacterium]
MKLPERKSPRLRGYDYSLPGAYFVTICTQNREHIFEIENVGNDLCVVPPEQNRIIHKWLKETENKFNNIKIDKYVIMPNHIHIIVVIKERHTGRSLHDVMRWFETMVTNEYIRKVKIGLLKPFKKRLFQQSFHDHIIRGEKDYHKIWEYIDTNPLKWELDCFYNNKRS